MKNIACGYKHKIEEELREHMGYEMGERFADYLKALTKSWLRFDDIQKRLENEPMCESYGETEKPFCRLSAEEIHSWNRHMLNADGSEGGKWTEAETTALAGQVGVYFQHITPAEWNVTMNMEYSDFNAVATRFSLDPAIYAAESAKAFLFDRDGGIPHEKLCKFYRNVVRKM